MEQRVRYEDCDVCEGKGWLAEELVDEPLPLGMRVDEPSGVDDHDDRGPWCALSDRDDAVDVDLVASAVNVSIRRADVHDAEAICALRMRFLDELARRWLPDAQVERLLALEGVDASADRLTAGPAAIAEDPHGMPVGFGQYLPGAGPGVCELQLFVIPECQGRGAGSALLDWLQRSATNDGTGVFCVEADPTQSAFFRRHGFTPTEAAAGARQHVLCKHLRHDGA